MTIKMRPTAPGGMGCSITSHAADLGTVEGAVSILNGGMTVTSGARAATFPAHHQSGVHTRPSDSTGYVITGFEAHRNQDEQVLMTDLLPQYFENVGIHHSCATGYIHT